MDPENIERLGPESLAQPVLRQSSLLKSTYHLHSFRGKWDRVSRKLPYNGTKSVGSYASNVAQREHRTSQVCHRLSAQWLCDWQPAKHVPEFRWETKFLPHTTGPQGKSQTCLTLNNEQQSASCIMSAINMGRWTSLTMLLVCLVCFISCYHLMIFGFFFKLISYAFFPLCCDISSPITHIPSF